MSKSNRLKGSVIGIDISDRGIKACEVEEENGRYLLRSVSQLKFEEGIITRGVVKDEKRFKLALHEALSNAGPSRFKAKKVVFSLPESAVYTSSDQLPLDFNSEGSNRYIKSKVAGVLSENFADMYVTSSISTRKNLKRLVFFITGKVNTDLLYKSFKREGLEVIGIESEACRVSRSIIEQINPFEGIVFIDMGFSLTSVTISDELGVSLSTAIPIAGKTIDGIISGILKIPDEEAEEIKWKYGLGKSKYIKYIKKQVIALLDKIVLEVKDAISFYRNSTGNDIKKVFILGGMSNMIGLLEYISSNLPGFIVERAKPWISIDIKEGQEVTNYLGSISLALKGLNLNESLGRNNLVFEINKKQSGIIPRKISFLEKLKTVLPFWKWTSKKEILKDKKEDWNKYEVKEEDLSVSQRLTQQRGILIKPLNLDTYTKKSMLLGDKNNFIEAGDEHEDKDDSGNETPSPKNRKLIIIILTLLLVFPASIFMIYSLLFNGGNISKLYEQKQERETIDVSEQLTIKDNLKEDNGLKYEIVNQIFSRKETFIPTGESSSSDVISGTVVIINSTNITYTLVASTRLLNESDFLYRLDNEVTIPAHSEVEAQITASGSGNEYTLERNCTLRFPGLNPELQDDIYATNRQDLIIGDGLVVTDEDLINAEEALREGLEEVNYQDLEVTAGEGVVFADKVLDVSVESMSFNADVGEQVEEFEGNVESKVSILEFTTSDIETYLRGKLEGILKKDENVDEYYFDGIVVIINLYDLESHNIDITINAQAINKG